MKKLFLSFALLSINAYIIGAGADVKETESTIIEQADKWAQEALKDLTDLEQIVLINITFALYKALDMREGVSSKSGRKMRVPTRSQIYRVEPFKKASLIKLAKEIEQEASAIKFGEQSKINFLKHKFLALKKYATVPDEYKVEIFEAPKYSLEWIR